jgi:amino acid transporter
MSRATTAEPKLGFQGAWSMAVGGMVGGGIFSTLGVVVGIAGPMAWLSFVLAGVIALLAGYSYVKLAAAYGEGGGAFTFLREVRQEELAGSLAWVLILGYILTNAVYAFTFGEYIGHVLPMGDVGARLAAVAILLTFVVVNLRGTGEAGGVEVFLVWFKLVVLVGLAVFGLSRWDPQLLARGVPEGNAGNALLGAASVFMAYEGFQLLTYDYDDIDEPRRTLPRALLSAIVVVIAVYVAVALGTPMLIGADQVVEGKEVALSIAGREALGVAGVAIVTVAAAFSTGSAINATLFATARLSHEVASAGELPAALEHRNRHGVPDRAVLSLGLLAALFATVGSLADLVESASLAFLVTFSVVSALAFIERVGSRVLTAIGASGAAAAAVGLTVRLARNAPMALALFGAMVLLAVVGRPILLKHFRGPTQE